MTQPLLLYQTSLPPWDQYWLDRGRDEFPDAAKAESLSDVMSHPEVFERAFNSSQAA